MAPETRQQIIALVLGIIFIIGFVLLAQRLGQFLRNRQQGGRVANERLTPNPRPEVTGITLLISPTPTEIFPAVMDKTKQPTTIPQTGPESLLVSLFALFGIGILTRTYKPR